jgi:4-oxalocrotonate tautomerase
VPILTVLLSGAPDAQRDAAVAEALAQLTADVLRKDLGLTSVALGHVPGTQWFVGGAPLEAQRRASFFVDVRVTAGTNSHDEKARYIRAVFARMRDLLGDLHEASYVHVHEVPADSWGYEGVTQAQRHAARVATVAWDFSDPAGTRPRSARTSAGGLDSRR